MREVLFDDRRDAGRQLAAALRPWQRSNPVVLGLPRGGVPVAFEVATMLDAPLAVFVVRKLGVPGHGELAMGALASGGVRVLNDDIVRELRIPQEAIDAVVAMESAELARRETLFEATSLPALLGRIVILVDDGLATGATMRAAVEAVRHHHPARVIVAVPVGAPDTCRTLRGIADDVVCLHTPVYFSAVGMWYRSFDQTTDDEVRALLAAASKRQSVGG
jgi:predicted phosphoribosyltransferase